METDHISLLDLQEYLRGGIEQLFPQNLWVRAEIASVQVKANGHCYLDLCQSDKGKLLAKAKAVIWKNRYLPIRHYLQETIGDNLQAGMEILARVWVSYSELYGLTLTIEEVEPCFTMGQAELERRRTIERLEEDGLMDLQKQLPSPQLPYKLAVISAKDAAGFGDFKRQLLENEYGFAFEVDLFEAAMQGSLAPASISDAIAMIECSEQKYDAALIIRGGGSALDLACFDDYGLCVSIAQCAVPVYTAIGHDRDYHVADMVAHMFVKTPTALAAAFVDAVADEDEAVSARGMRLRMAFSARIAAMEAQLDVIASRIHSSDPRNVLSRGYALVVGAGGKVVKSARKIGSGESIKILFEDGQIEATTK